MRRKSVKEKEVSEEGRGGEGGRKRRRGGGSECGIHSLLDNKCFNNVKPS